MAYLDYEKLEATEAHTDPYNWLICENFVNQSELPSILEDYPEVPGAGSHPPSELEIQGKFKELMAELDQPRFRNIIEQKFNVDLNDKPTMYTVRGFCRKKDGAIHCDSKSKIITVLLYMNEEWDTDGGRLRILRSQTDLEDKVAEVPPHGGTLLIFKRADNSWHGHEPFEGKRRAVQMNWVTGENIVAKEQRRHRFSNLIKRFKRKVVAS